MKDEKIGEVVRTLRKCIREWTLPIVTYLAEKKESPYTILISTILSLRTKDQVTAEASSRLFLLADTPEVMLKLSASAIADAIYPVGFYKRKAITILNVSRVLMEKFGGRVPDTIEELLTLNGVGRKTANLVISLGYGKKGICVDTHVHRISNRLGYVKTRTPEKTESALREKLPRRYWIEYNTLMVAFGQNVCKPISPLCSICPVARHCDRVGVVRSR
jgi:endonuclease-3